MPDNELFYLRIIWAIFLSIIYVSGFRKSQKIESGEKETFFQGKNNSVNGLDPIVFPIMIAFFISISFLLRNIFPTTTDVVSFVFDLLFFVTIYFSILAFSIYFLRKIFTAKTCAALWLVPVFLFYHPQFLMSLQLSVTKVIFIPGKVVAIFCFVWFIGFTVIFVMQFISHWIFFRHLKQSSKDVSDGEILDLWAKIKSQIGVTFDVPLKYSSVIKTPLSIGMTEENIITFLPQKNYASDELEMIFNHEIRHLQRKDSHVKFFLKFCFALGWFHPFVWIALRRAEEDLELSCDELVLQGADGRKREKYAQLLLRTAGTSRGYTTCLSVSAKTLRYRLRASISEKKKRSGLVLMFAVMFLSGMVIGNIAISTERGTIAGITNQEIAEVTRAELVRGADKSDLISDTEALSSYLSELQIETVRYRPVQYEGEKSIYAKDEGAGRVYEYSENYLTIYYYNESEERVKTEFYYLRDKINWEYIEMLV